MNHIAAKCPFKGSDNTRAYCFQGTLSVVVVMETRAVTVAVTTASPAVAILFRQYIYSNSQITSNDIHSVSFRLAGLSAGK